MIFLIIWVFIMAFKRPNRQECISAIGSLNKLPSHLKRAFTPNDKFFEPMPSPKPGDWLAEHYEPGQSFNEYANEVQIKGAGTLSG